MPLSGKSRFRLGRAMPVLPLLFAATVAAVGSHGDFQMKLEFAMLVYGHEQLQRIARSLFRT